MGESQLSSDNITDELDEFLEHHGIKGMHWGVRRKSPQEDNSSEDAKRAASSKAMVKKSGASALSNADLQHLVTRMNLEQQLSRSTPPSKTSQAAKFVAGIMIQVGKEEATKLIKKQANKQIKSLLAKGSKE